MSDPDIRTQLGKLCDELTGLSWSIRNLAREQAEAEESYLCPHTVEALAAKITQRLDDMPSMLRDVPDPAAPANFYDTGFSDACRSIRAAMRGPKTAPVSDRAMNEMCETLDAIREARA